MQNKPNFRKSQMNVSNIITRNYKNFIPLAGQKNKPNSNPILSAVGGLQMNLKSLAGKSGHTRRSPMGAIILTFVSDMHILKRFLQGEVK